VFSTTSEIPAASRGTAQEFIMERKYLKNVTTKTLDWYGHSFKAFCGCESEADYKTRIIQLRERGVSAVSVNTYLRCINAYLNWKGAGYKLPKLKEEQKILQTLSAEAIRALIHFRPSGRNLTRAHLVALTILDTGLRASEALGLTKEDVCLDNLIMKVVGKGGKHRLVPFSPELRKHLFRNALKASVSGSGILFGTKHQTKVSVRNVERDFQILGKKCGITGVRFSPHTLRHTFAVTSLRNGMDLYSLSRILGHSSITTTQVYLRSLGIEDLKLSHQRASPLSKFSL
jgi:integrase/recombinase XerD